MSTHTDEIVSKEICGRFFVYSRFNRLGDGSNLVDFEEKTVTSLLVYGCLDTFGVGHSQIVTEIREKFRDIRNSLPPMMLELWPWKPTKLSIKSENLYSGVAFQRLSQRIHHYNVFFSSPDFT